MALRNNYSNANRQIVRNLAGNLGLCGLKTAQLSGGYLRLRDISMNRAYGNAFGYAGSSSWSLPLKGGGMASYKRAQGSGNISGNAAQGIGVAANLSGSGAITNADLALIISLASNLVGTGLINTAQLQSIQNMQAALTGGGQISAANMSMLVGVSATLAGSGQVSSANIIGLAHMTAAITIGGTGYLSNDDVVRLASAVWDETTASHSTAGTTGKALQDAGSAGNPWSASLSSNNSPNTFGWYIQKLLTVAKFLGLK